VARTAAALALFSFLRSFAQVLSSTYKSHMELMFPPQTWGITITSTILQNELKKHLPADFISQFPHRQEIAYAVIPKIRTLEEPLRTEVRRAFSRSMSTVWKTMAGISGFGILLLFLLHEVPMNRHTDEHYGLMEGSSSEEGLEVKAI
jgi:hypothetical protein